MAEEQIDLFDEFDGNAVIAGIDEAGRGPLAGPVVAAAVVLRPGAVPDGLTDSKLLPPDRREALFEALCPHCDYAVGQASVEEIDELNILQATFLAMRRALEGLACEVHGALIDGNHVPPRLKVPARYVIKGDLSVPAISAASIIAKVTRDRLMRDYARDYPDYGWDTNAGYGTAAHLEALNMVGISPLHRRSFYPVREILTQESRPKD